MRSVASERSRTLSTLFAEYHGPAFALRLWDGWNWCSSANEKPACTLVVCNPQALQSLLTEPDEISLGEAFVQRDLDVEGDLFSIFAVVEHLLRRRISLHHKVLDATARVFWDVSQTVRHGARHSERRDSVSISYHYDQPVAFYRPWLGETLAYSCAYFKSGDEALDRAQEQKLDLICRKLRLQPFEHFLDVGCGWGSLVLHAAKKYHAFAHGITLSKEQASVANERIERGGVAESCVVELRDYRTFEGVGPSFDKIASVGMFEHVGLQNLPRYFRIVRNLLTPGGTFLNHGIARSSLSSARKSSFIDRYVFPDGRLVTLTEALEAAESEGLEVRDVENLREHYEVTLRKWVEGMRRNAAQLLQQVSETTYRIWLLYTAGSAAAFHRGDIAVYQVLFNACGKSKRQAPLTRDDWYAAACPDEVGVH